MRLQCIYILYIYIYNIYIYKYIYIYIYIYNIYIYIYIYVSFEPQQNLVVHLAEGWWWRGREVEAGVGRHGNSVSGMI